MPTKNPRLTITLKPSLAAQLRTLSELSGNSQGSLISDLLEGSGPVFDRLIVVLTAAKEATASFKGSLVADLEKAQGQVEQQLGLAIDTFDHVTKPLLDHAEQIKRRSRRVSKVGPAKRGRLPAIRNEATPLSNRGVRSTKNTGPTRSKKHAPV